MANLQERFTRDLIEELRPANGFLAYSVNHSQYTNGKTVHVNHAGADPAVVVDRAGEGTAVERVDTDWTYSVNEFTTTPTRVKIRDEMRTNYNLRASVLQAHQGKLMTDIANTILHNWVGNTTISGVATALPAANIRETTGTGSGGKLLLVIADILWAKTQMDLADIPKEGRKMIFSPEMESQLLALSEVADAGFFGEKTLPSGKVMTVAGFEVIVRSFVPTYDVSGVSPVLQALGAVADSQSIVAWHPSVVTYAFSGAEAIISRMARAYGDEIATLALVGGSRQRQDGVFVITQADV